ncbi:MAG: low molecular weight protein arginine phosphatase [Tissierellales bacterium]|nr:low molecular weight protein arginine phosphatase [Tissierellales bacterium]MBN2828546.1 low molecular weight protein arginine phosphatase [Tissierellales bacterium]
MKIVFVCTGNTCRSPMAEALLKDLIKKGKLDSNAYEVSSAGVSAIENMAASENAISVLKDRGIDLSQHRARQISASIIKQADLILTMTRGHKNWIINVVPLSIDKVFTIKEYVGNQIQSDVSDPFGRSIDFYKQTADEIYELMEGLIKKIKEKVR